MSEDKENYEESIETLRDFIKRVTHWQEGRPDKHDALQALAILEDQIEWIEKGIGEWRDVAMSAMDKLSRRNGISV